jgi:hypothetical protein
VTIINTFIKSVYFYISKLAIPKMKNIIFRLSLLYVILVCSPFKLTGQIIDSSSFSIVPRQSFYSYEDKGEFLLDVPETLSKKHLALTLRNEQQIVALWEGIPGNDIVRVPFSINLKPAVYKIDAAINVTNSPGIKYISRTELTILSYKSNEVKTDKFTGGLIVNKLPFFPFGFYCYSPVYPSLPEEEVVKGFNLISPYQKIAPETLHERKAYMDRCAQIGMKVHYNLLSVSGGGGVGSKIEGLDEKVKRERLIEEIKTFRDHPALLGWYISDEPNGISISPAQLEEIYKTVRENDPWHPVSIVFMAPFLSSKKYSDALDIVMADPYPIPDNPVTVPGEVAFQLSSAFKGKKPFWIIPQSFGGGELWGREPTIQEIRSMTWQSIINGATGIQYFVRQGLNYFPKSAATWSECGRMAMEVAELTPWLLSDEETMPVTTTSKNILVTSRIHNNQLAIFSVNKINEPVSTTFRIKGLRNGSARVLFENRVIPIYSGVFTDQLSSLGSQVYLIDVFPDKKTTESANVNLIKDGGFEDLSNPGLPSACYARPGGDRGATYFLDTRDYVEGRHSLRIITPEENKSLAIRFFPISVRAGASYTISLWARSDPERKFSVVTTTENDRLLNKEEMPQYVEILLGEFGRARFIPDKAWKLYMTFVTIPKDTLARVKTNLILKMPGQGVAWFDDVKVTEDK